jgi:hypothetical protein
MPYHLSEDGLSVLGEDGNPAPGGRHKNRRQALAHLQALDANAPEAGKGLDLSYAKSLGVSLPDLAVKSLGRDEITGYLALWGSPAKTDLDRDFFTRSTDFWDDKLAFPRPLTWEHGQDDNFRGRVVIGQIDALTDDELGRVYHATLERAGKYRQIIDRLIEGGALGTSSDSAPQYVLREARGKAHWLRQWPLFAGALTASPAEPRMIDTVGFKSLGVQLPGQGSPDGQALELLKAQQDWLARYL